MQGFNMGRYVPPDHEGLTSGNRLHGRRPSPTIRFEMPYAVWCATCPRPTVIGQGVRFNAEKRRCGAHHSTAIWSFRFRHADCGGVIEMRTDPARTAYVVTSGATALARTRGGEHDGGGDAGPVLTDGERERRRRDAFARLERTIGDRKALARQRRRVEELRDAAERRWRDPYTLNQRLRRAFRAGRREREERAREDGALRRRLGLADGEEEDDDDGAVLRLLPATEADARRAALVDFAGGEEDELRRGALSRPLFGRAVSAEREGDGELNDNDEEDEDDGDEEHDDEAESVAAAGRRQMIEGGGGSRRRRRNVGSGKSALATRVVGNTRAARDPFLVASASTGSGAGARRSADGSGRPAVVIPGIKRRTGTDAAEATGASRQPATVKGVAALVQYDSD